MQKYVLQLQEGHSKSHNNCWNVLLSNKSVTVAFVLSCADPESVVRGGPTLTFFLFFFFCLVRGGRIQIPLL